MVSVKSVSSPAGRLPLTQETHWAPPWPQSQHLSKHLHSRRYLSLQEVSPGEILSFCLQMGFINIFPALNTHITLAPEKTNFLCLRIIFYSQQRTLNIDFYKDMQMELCRSPQSEAPFQDLAMTRQDERLSSCE